MVVDNGEGAAPELKARVTVRGGESGFGDGGIHNDFEMERTPDDGRALIFRADLSRSDAPAAELDGGIRAAAGAGTDVPGHRCGGGSAGHPGGPGTQGLQAIEMRSGETMSLSEAVQAQFGDETEAVHLANTVLANHPFAAVTVHAGNGVFAYRVSTAPGMQQVEDLDREATTEPQPGGAQRQAGAGAGAAPGTDGGPDHGWNAREGDRVARAGGKSCDERGRHDFSRRTGRAATCCTTGRAICCGPAGRVSRATGS